MGKAVRRGKSICGCRKPAHHNSHRKGSLPPREWSHNTSQPDGQTSDHRSLEQEIITY